MTAWICAACGNQQSDAGQPPETSAICLDERQYVGEGGQRWTTLAELAAAGHRSDVRELEPGLLGIGVQPSFAIGQRGLVVTTDAGNVLYDVPGFLDDAAAEAARRAGGLVAVTASHPHFYGVMIEWSRAFGGVPVLLPETEDATAETWTVAWWLTWWLSTRSGVRPSMLRSYTITSNGTCPRTSGGSGWLI